jgi:hypothetical protein
MKTSNILFACFLLADHTISRAASHQVIIPASGKDLVVYCFDTNNLENALPNVPDNTIVYLWDVTAQQYYSSIGGGGAWFPNYTLSPGQGFFIQNPLAEDYTYTIQGTPLTASSYELTFPDPSKLYLVGSAYDTDVDGGGNWLECISDCFGNYRYTRASYNYHGSNGDTIWFWCPDSQDWSVDIVRTTPNCEVVWGGATCTECSPQLTWGSNNCSGPLNNGGHHRGIFLKPAGGTPSWIQFPLGQNCGP